MATKLIKTLKVEDVLFLVLKYVSLPDDKWSETARKYLWSYCKAVHGEAVKEILKSYELGRKIAKENPTVLEVIKNDH